MVVYARYKRYPASNRLSTNAQLRRRGRDRGRLEISPIPVNPANALCLDFANSTFSDHTGKGRVYDRLPSPEWWQWMAARWQLSLPAQLRAADTRKLRQFRSRLRSMLERAGSGQVLGQSELDWLNRRLARSARRVSVPAWTRGSQILLMPLTNDWDAVIAEVLFSYAVLMKEGFPRRIRRCANPACSWIFYDSSRNRSRRWCDPRYCGDLIKVRRHRAKQR